MDKEFVRISIGNTKEEEEDEESSSLIHSFQQINHVVDADMPSFRSLCPEEDIGSTGSSLPLQGSGGCLVDDLMGFTWEPCVKKPLSSVPSIDMDSIWDIILPPNPLDELGRVVVGESFNHHHPSLKDC